MLKSVANSLKVASPDITPSADPAPGGAADHARMLHDRAKAQAAPIHNRVNGMMSKVMDTAMDNDEDEKTKKAKAMSKSMSNAMDNDEDD
jgi:hypothetical protein